MAKFKCTTILNNLIYEVPQYNNKNSVEIEVIKSNKNSTEK